MVFFQRVVTTGGLFALQHDVPVWMWLLRTCCLLF